MKLLVDSFQTSKNVEVCAELETIKSAKISLRNKRRTKDSRYLRRNQHNDAAKDEAKDKNCDGTAEVQSPPTATGASTAIVSE